MEQTDEGRESQLRRRADQLGLRIGKSCEAVSNDNQGGYMVLDGFKDLVVAGSHYDMTLEDLERFLYEEA